MVGRGRRTKVSGALFAEGFQDFVGVFGDVDLVKDLGDLAGFVDKERFAYRSHVFFAVHTLFAPDTVLLNDLFVGVGDQVKGQRNFEINF